MSDYLAPDSSAPAGYRQLTAFLAAEFELPEDTVKSWARFLAGLPWRYVPPLVRIAVNTNNAAASALRIAAAYSEDVEFKAAAKVHLDRMTDG